MAPSWQHGRITVPGGNAMDERLFEARRCMSCGNCCGNCCGVCLCGAIPMVPEEI